MLQRPCERLLAYPLLEAGIQRQESSMSEDEPRELSLDEIDDLSMQAIDQITACLAVTVRSGSFHNPQPSKRGGDINAAIGRVCPTGGARINKGQEPSERGERRHARHQPPCRLAEAQPCPERETPGDFQGPCRYRQ